MLKRTLREYKADNLGDLAAALTYYGVLAIFPMLIVVVSLLGLLGHSVTQSLITEPRQGGAVSDPRQIFTKAIQNIQSHRSTAGVLFIVGLIARVVVGLELHRRVHACLERRLGRRGRTADLDHAPTALGVTLITVVLLTITAAAVVFTGGLADQLGNLIGVGHSAVTIWDIAKWPVLLLVVAFILAILYWASPNVRQPGFRWVTPGGLIAVALWVLASGAFASTSRTSRPTTRPTERWPR